MPKWRHVTFTGYEHAALAFLNLLEMEDGHSLFGPLVLTPNLLLLLFGEVILDVERLTNLLWGLVLDHVCDGLAADVEQGLDVEVVGREDDLKEHLLVNLHELLIPLFNVRRPLARVGVVVGAGRWVGLVVLAPFEDFLEDYFVDLGVAVSRGWHSRCPEGHTFGTGMASSWLPSVPKSSRRFLISMDRSATWRSVALLAKKSFRCSMIWQ